MRGVAVGLYCAVVDPFDPSVSTHGIATRETQTMFDGRIGGPRTWLGTLNLGSVGAMGLEFGAVPLVRPGRPDSWACAVVLVGICNLLTCFK